ncbi:hypothetical protein [Synechocystis salina]|uniref:Uncharacterized protein n=1 Tax=Synechocystis salina LEGE 00031 TaxID=1828736 RepID=A0ABR9VTD1_9SYNC|nr:hypothetical protein [Synechocystis salina]MBE9242553.1 hypothetical protein [Synechocystis salina LEGE 00041]MBE9254608.1 hypothetical protein [Synechocystis salina LEGE 00031]
MFYAYQAAVEFAVSAYYAWLINTGKPEKKTKLQLAELEGAITKKNFILLGYFPIFLVEEKPNI